MSAEGAAQIRFVFCAGPSGLGYLQFIPRADARGYSLLALRAWIPLNFVIRAELTLLDRDRSRDWNLGAQLPDSERTELMGQEQGPERFRSPPPI